MPKKLKNAGKSSVIDKYICTVVRMMNSQLTR